MNATSMQRFTLTCGGALVALTLAGPASAAYRCDAPVFRYDRVACAEAKKSPDDLRRYVERTQLMFNLYFYDYIKPGELDRHRAGMRAEGPTAEQEQAAREQAATQ